MLCALRKAQIHCTFRILTYAYIKMTKKKCDFSHCISSLTETLTKFLYPYQQIHPHRRTTLQDSFNDV